MPDVLCMYHGGIQCGLPPASVIAVSPVEEHRGDAWLWMMRPGVTSAEEDAEVRALCILTARGPRTIVAFGLELLSITEVRIWRIPPLVRELLPDPHVVGLAEIDEGLIWLVDPERFHPADSTVQTETPCINDARPRSSMRSTDRA